LMAPGIATPPGYTLLSSVQFLNTLLAAWDDGIAKVAIAKHVAKIRNLFISKGYLVFRHIVRSGSRVFV